MGGGGRGEWGWRPGGDCRPAPLLQPHWGPALRHTQHMPPIHPSLMDPPASPWGTTEAPQPPWGPALSHVLQKPSVPQPFPSLAGAQTPLRAWPPRGRWSTSTTDSLCNTQNPRSQDPPSRGKWSGAGRGGGSACPQAGLLGLGPVLGMKRERNEVPHAGGMPSGVQAWQSLQEGHHPSPSGQGLGARYCWAAESRLPSAGPGSPSPPGAGRAPPSGSPSERSRGQGGGREGLQGHGGADKGTSQGSPGPRARWTPPPRGHPASTTPPGPALRSPGIVPPPSPQCPFPSSELGWRPENF